MPGTLWSLFSSGRNINRYNRFSYVSVCWGAGIYPIPRNLQHHLLNGPRTLKPECLIATYATYWSGSVGKVPYANPYQKITQDAIWRWNFCHLWCNMQSLHTLKFRCRPLKLVGLIWSIIAASNIYMSFCRNRAPGLYGQKTGWTHLIAIVNYFMFLEGRSDINQSVSNRLTNKEQSLWCYSHSKVLVSKFFSIFITPKKTCKTWSSLIYTSFVHLRIEFFQNHHLTNTLPIQQKHQRSTHGWLARFTLKLSWLIAPDVASAKRQWQANIRWGGTSLEIWLGGMVRL